MHLKFSKLTPFLLFAIIAFFLLRGLYLNPHELPSTLIGKELPKFSLPALGQASRFENADLGENYAILNIFASWCDNCINEQSFLLKLARQNIPLYGISYKDCEQDTSKWLKTWGDPYKKIGMDIDGKTAIELGVYGAPETFLLDSDHKIILRHTGVLDEKTWQEQFIPQINKLRDRVG